MARCNHKLRMMMLVSRRKTLDRQGVMQRGEHVNGELELVDYKQGLAPS
jgi:hypothetical protein